MKGSSRTHGSVPGTRLGSLKAGGKEKKRRRRERERKKKEEEEKKEGDGSVFHNILDTLSLSKRTGPTYIIVCVGELCGSFGAL